MDPDQTLSVYEALNNVVDDQKHAVCDYAL